MAIIWQSTVNKSGVRTPVCETNIEYVATQITSAAMKIFGTNINGWNDQVWEEYIDPFIDQYIHNFFSFEDGLVTRQDLDNEIEIHFTMMEQSVSDYEEE